MLTRKKSQLANMTATTTTTSPRTVTFSISSSNMDSTFSTYASTTHSSAVSTSASMDNSVPTTSVVYVTQAPLLHVGTQNTAGGHNFHFIEKPQFFGELVEEPSRFLEQMENYFAQTSTSAERRVATLRACLQGAAADWWSKYDGLLQEYENFRYRFLRRYNGGAVRKELEHALYDAPQKRGESIEVYMLKKRRIWQRLQGLRPVAEAEAVRAAMYGTVPTHHVRLQAKLPNNFAEAIQLALDLDEEFPASCPVLPPGNKSRMLLDVSPPRCWHCPELAERLQGTDNRPKPPCSSPWALYLGLTDEECLPHIQIRIDDRHTYTVLDSASTENYIRQDYISSSTQVLPGQEGQARLASRKSRLDIKGKAIVTSWIQGSMHQVPMLVAEDLSVPAILGIPWFRQQRARLDFQLNQIHFGGTVRYSVSWEQLREPSDVSSPPVNHGFPENTSEFRTS